ncbi:MAG: hypothetical protein ACK5RL_05345 [Acidimicrobiales bacterium]
MTPSPTSSRATGTDTTVGLADRIRIESALFRLDFWLDLANVGRSRRKDIRRDLRANLMAAAHTKGVDAALVDIGSLRSLAREYAAGNDRVVRWSAGLTAAVTVAAVYLLLAMLAALNWASGVMDGGATTAQGHLFPFLWSSVSYADLPGGGFEVDTNFGPGALAVFAVTFILVARPWRLLRRH